MEKPSVLVVEDTEEIRKLISTVLDGPGWRCAPSARERSAWRRCGARRPTSIVLDLGLPDTDGTELCRQIRAETPATS